MKTNITKFARWICGKVTLEEFSSLLTLFLDIISNQRPSFPMNNGMPGMDESKAEYAKPIYPVSPNERFLRKADVQELVYTTDNHQNHPTDIFA